MIKITFFLLFLCLFPTPTNSQVLDVITVGCSSMCASSCAAINDNTQCWEGCKNVFRILAKEGDDGLIECYCTPGYKWTGEACIADSLIDPILTAGPTYILLFLCVGLFAFIIVTTVFYIRKYWELADYERTNTNSVPSQNSARKVRKHSENGIAVPEQPTKQLATKPGVPSPNPSVATSSSAAIHKPPVMPKADNRCVVCKTPNAPIRLEPCKHPVCMKCLMTVHDCPICGPKK